MPVSTFQVKPTTDGGYRKGEKVAGCGSGSERESFEEVRAILLQLGHVATYATAMFQDLFNETSATTERVEKLAHTVEQKIFAADPDTNMTTLQFIENRIVHSEEPMRLYETPGKQPRPLPQTELEGNLFAMASMPPGLAERYRSQTDADMDFSAVDELSEGFGADGFKEAGLMYSNPNAFQEMYFEQLAEQAKATKAKKKEKKKAARDRKKSIKGEKKSDARRVRKRQIDKDTGLEIDDPAEVAFKKIDKDGNGFLCLGELAAAFQHLEHDEFNLSQEQVEAAMSQMDHDGDGKVSMEEFANFVAMEMTSLLAGEKPVYNQKADDFYYVGAAQADSSVRSFYTDAAVAAVAPPKLPPSTAKVKAPAAQRLELTTGVVAAPARAPASVPAQRGATAAPPAPSTAPPAVPAAAPPPVPAAAPPPVPAAAPPPVPNAAPPSLPSASVGPPASGPPPAAPPRPTSAAPPPPTSAAPPAPPPPPADYEPGQKSGAPSGVASGGPKPPGPAPPPPPPGYEGKRGAGPKPPGPAPPPPPPGSAGGGSESGGSGQPMDLLSQIAAGKRLKSASDRDGGGGGSGGGDGKPMDLLQQIQQGKQLRSANDPNSPRGSIAKDEEPQDLLAQIRGAGGIKALKKVEKDDRDAAAQNPEESGNNIAAAMERYRQLVADSDSDSDSDFGSDDDWSD